MKKLGKKIILYLSNQPNNIYQIIESALVNSKQEPLYIEEKETISEINLPQCVSVMHVIKEDPLKPIMEKRKRNNLWKSLQKEYDNKMRTQLKL